MRLLALTALLLPSMILAMQPPKPKVTRTALAALEKDLDGRFSKPGQPEPYDLLGNTRGVYLEGYGVIFTTELNLVFTPALTPFRPAVTKEEVESVRSRKLAKLEVLKKTMREMLAFSAASLDSLPRDERVVMAVSLFYFSWEQKVGLPSQIVMQAPRGALLMGPGQKLDAALKVEEF